MDYDPDYLLDTNDLDGFGHYLDAFIKKYVSYNGEVRGDLLSLFFHDELKLSIFRDRLQICKLILERIRSLYENYPDINLCTLDFFRLWSNIVSHMTIEFCHLFELYDFIPKINDVRDNKNSRYSNAFFYNVYLFDQDKVRKDADEGIEVNENKDNYLIKIKEDKEELIKKHVEDNKNSKNITYYSGYNMYEIFSYWTVRKTKSVDILKYIESKFDFDLQRYLYTTEYLNKDIFEYVKQELGDKLELNEYTVTKLFLINDAEYRHDQLLQYNGQLDCRNI